MEMNRENYDELFRADPKTVQTQPAQSPKSREEWAAEQKEQREALYALADGMADRTLSDPAHLQQFIETQARLGRESVTNTLILMYKCPEASRTHTFEEWKRMGRSIKSGEQAMSLLARGREYVREDGTKGTFMNVKKVFDIHQTTGRAIRQPPVHPVSNRLKALMTGTRVPIILSDVIPQHVGALYSPQDNTIEVARGLTGDKLFFTVARELARAESTRTTFMCDCVANILACRYDMAPAYPDRVPEEYANLEPAQKRLVLSEVRQVACEMEKHMDRNLQRMIQPQERQQDAPER